MERWLGAAPSSDAPGTGRSGTEGRVVRAEAKRNVKKEEIIWLCS